MISAYIPSTEDKTTTLRQGLSIERLVVVDKVDHEVFIWFFNPGDALITPEVVSLGNSMLKIVGFIKEIVRRGTSTSRCLLHHSVP